MTHPGQLLKQAGLFAGKELGQNFLSNPGLAAKLVDRMALSEQALVLEIGPGLGALTLPLAARVCRVIAVEKDARLIPLLKQEMEQAQVENVDLIHADVLDLDLKATTKDKKLVVLGNLPYNISSQILFKLVEEREWVEKAFLMFQKELAMRILSPPGSRDYSRLSVVSQYAADISWMADVGPSAFFPRPDVDSTVLKFDFRTGGQTDLLFEQVLFKVVKAAFSKRRKTLRNAMTGGEGEYDRDMVLKSLALAGIDSGRRAETLSVDEFKRIAGAVRQYSLDSFFYEH